MQRDRILIVDDESDIALILKLKLEDAGYATVRARDGVEALECLDRESFALMLLDIKMPRLDGIEVLVRAQVDHRDVAVIMMTAHGSEDIAVEAMKKGAVDYIPKPFSTEDILKKVDRALQFNRTRLENLRLQREVEAERNKLEAILQGMADLLVAVDDQGKVIVVNRRAEELFGVGRNELYGKPVQEVLKSDIGPEQLPCMIVLATQAPCLDVMYNLTAGSRKIPVLSSATPLLNNSGKVVGSVEIIRDISTLKALEQEKEDFVSMLSHDLKSPLTAIVGSIDLVREERLGKINQEQKEYLDAAMESSNEAVEMINTLLDVHRFEAGKMSLTFSNEEPQPLIQRVIAGFGPVATRGHIRLLTTLREPLPPVPVDRKAFVRLLGNLLSNSLKFTPEGGDITVHAELVDEPTTFAGRIPAAIYPQLRLAEQGSYLCIAVRDSGVGIPQEALPTIFDRFVQARNRNMGKTAGTGLGLAYCRKVMDAHRGYVWAESVTGEGSTFFLLFPLTMQ